MEQHQLSATVESAPTPISVSLPIKSNCRTVAVTSGKGGVGKSSIAVNLAIALSQAGSKVCLLDANLGLANVDLLCGLNGYWNLTHVVTGARNHLNEVMLEGPAGIHVIPGASGIEDIADCPPNVQQELLRQMQQLEADHDFLIIDTGTGIHRLVRGFLVNADIALLVTTPEPTSLADAYATIKSLSSSETPEILALVNQADSIRQAHAIIERLQQTSRLFVKTEVGSAGFIPRDPHVSQAVIARIPVMIAAPNCPASAAIRQLGRRLDQSAAPRGGFFHRLLERFSKRAA
ncbi:MAG: MinD/ParA family protein [Planctomycetota bacterium]|nr:MinD/ParA family protein [Planctomycetota bacterium]